MASKPEPLNPGAVLAGRFEIEKVIGRGGFGIAYLATDRSRNDHVVVKELAPEGAVRVDGGFLDLDSLGGATAHRLRRCFLDEAKLLARLNIPGVCNVRTYAVEAGTAFYVTDFVADAQALDAVLQSRGPLPLHDVLDIAHQLMCTLEAVHARGVLHRDLKPANVLLRPGGETLLIDFGAAREWHADMTEHHTVLFTPGYAPLEQLSERAKRGPATDVYGLSALLYALLAGLPPEPSTDRLNGLPLTPIRTRRPEVDSATAHAVESGLALHYAERPQTMAELRNLFANFDSAQSLTTLESLDQKLVALGRLSFGRRQCPSCDEVQHNTKPLPKGRCPVCDRGHIAPRPIHHGLCPACKSGILRATPNQDPLAICPLCETGVLAQRRAKLLSKDKIFACVACEAQFTQRGADVTLDSGGPDPELYGRVETWPEWAAATHRSAVVHICDGCAAQYDEIPDGQWQQMLPQPGLRDHSRLYPDEWARVASGLDPGCGTHVCSACEADYFVDEDRVTLLGAHEDPFGFAAANAGRLLTWDAIRWLGVGKVSPHPGPTCLRCFTEFDTEGGYLRLIRTSNRALIPFLSTLQTAEDWHRIGLGLPRVDEQSAFEESLEQAILSAYLTGELSFDDRDTIWKSQATRLADNSVGTLTINPTEVTFGGLLRKDRTPLELLSQATADGNIITLRYRGQADPDRFEIEETEISIHLASGDRVATLDCSDLAERLSAMVLNTRAATPTG